MSAHNFINYKEFEDVDIRIGTVIEAYEYNKLKRPSIVLKIDFGEKIGVKKTSAQLQKYNKSDKLLNKQVIAVVNFEPKQIGKIIFALYYLTLFTWLNDENESLEKTMSVLDKYLNNIEKVIKFA